MSSLDYKAEISSPDHVLRKTVKRGGTVGLIYVPKEWIGKKVDVIFKGEE